MRAPNCAAKLVSVLAITGLAFAAGESRKDLHFKVGKHPTVSINNPYGPVVVKAGANREVVVTAILHSDRVELDQSKSHNRIDIVSHLLAGADRKTGIVEYEVQVPRDANVTLHSDTGRIHAEIETSVKLGLGDAAVADLRTGRVDPGGDGKGIAESDAGSDPLHSSYIRQPWGQWEWPLTISSPERAILELMDEVPQRETFHQADVLIEGLRNLSPRRLQRLLTACRSVKVKRLFLWFAERHQHAWLKKLDSSRIDLGKGKRMLVRGGKLDPKFKITVPESIDAGG